MKYRNKYQVFVIKEEQERELVDTFDSLNEAQATVTKFRNNRDRHIAEGTELAYHYKGLEWTIINIRERSK